MCLCVYVLHVFVCVCVCVVYQWFLRVPGRGGQPHGVMPGPWDPLLGSLGGAEEVEDVHGGGAAPLVRSHLVLLTQEGEEPDQTR